MTDTPNSGTVSVSRELLAASLAIPKNNTEFQAQIKVIEQLRAILAQPAEQQDEPVCWFDGEGNKYRLCPVAGNLQIRHAPYGSEEAWLDVKMTPAHALNKLYRRPAAQAVKLPDRKSVVDTFNTYGLGVCRGFNDALDIVAKLNGIKP